MNQGSETYSIYVTTLFHLYHISHSPTVNTLGWGEEVSTLWCILHHFSRGSSASLAQHTWINNASQTHRMFEVERDLWRSFGPTPLLKQGHLELVAQGHVESVSEHLQGWKLPSLSSNRSQHQDHIFPTICILPSTNVGGDFLCK